MAQRAAMWIVLGVLGYGGFRGYRICTAVEYWDERFSTAAAERTLLEADLSRRQRKQHIDAVAAQFILQGWLDRARRGGQGDDAIGT